MDQELKQRLIGAVVISALAAIFIPMLFDDPVQDQGKFINELKIPEPPKETFAETAENLPDSVEQVLTLPEAPPLYVEQPKAQKPETPASGLVRWIIQVGSFADRKNALILQDELRKKGFSTFLDSVETEKNGKLFRLRIGPELDKKRAEVIKVKLEKQFQLQPILIAE